jgi:hypothetical protein
MIYLYIFLEFLVKKFLYNRKLHFSLFYKPCAQVNHISSR